MPADSCLQALYDGQVSDFLQNGCFSFWRQGASSLPTFLGMFAFSQRRIYSRGICLVLTWPAVQGCPEGERSSSVVAQCGATPPSSQVLHWPWRCCFCMSKVAFSCACWRMCLAVPLWYRSDSSASSNHLLPGHWKTGTPFSSSSAFLPSNLAALNWTWCNWCSTECRKLRETLGVHSEMLTLNSPSFYGTTALERKL